MKTAPTQIPHCYLLDGDIHYDPRGSFYKMLHEPTLQALGLQTDFRESFITTSRKGTIRGMHFQTPPSEHAKLVSCVSGTVLDVLVDLRVGSPVYGVPVWFPLRGDTTDLLYIPSGVAHGFAALEDATRVLYYVTTVHDPDHDAGIAWDSIGLDWIQAVDECGFKGLRWADVPPVLSERDTSLPRLTDYQSPFLFVA